MNILVVDDERFNLAIAKEIITANIEKAEVLLCTSPEEVIPLLAQTPIDVILLDIVMPKLNGIELLKQIRSKEEYKEIQVLMFTGVTNKESFRQCFEFGANDYIGKPIDVTEFAARMRAAVQTRKNLLKLKEAQFYLLQQEKLASLGEIAAGVAHEINNPIGFVSSNLETMGKYTVKLRDLIVAYRKLLELVADEHSSRQDLLQEKQQIEELEKKQKINMLLADLEPIITESKDGINRVSQIVKSLRNFARIGTEAERATNIMSDIVDEALLIMRNEIKYTAQLRKNLSPVPDVICNKGQIAQVLINIFSNASQAIKSQNRDEMGNILVEVYQENNYVVCKITDDGPGIKPEHLARIFDPFFTTKDVGKGTGLGLSIAYGIIKEHSGEFLVESQWGEGASFIIKLPWQEAV